MEDSDLSHQNASQCMSTLLILARLLTEVYLFLYQFALYRTEPPKCQHIIHFLVCIDSKAVTLIFIVFKRLLVPEGEKEKIDGKQTRDHRHSSLCLWYWYVSASEEPGWTLNTEDPSGLSDVQQESHHFAKLLSAPGHLSQKSNRYVLRGEKAASC